jgi:hypothetical protein
MNPIRILFASILVFAAVATAVFAAQRKETPLPCPPACEAYPAAKLDRAMLDRGTIGHPMD